MKIAIIGMGNMGCGYAERLGGNSEKDGPRRSVRGMELAAVTRVRPERLEKLKDILPSGLPVYPSADALFEAVDKGELKLDAVLIATPHYAHEEQAIKAFERGLHVLSDKPAGVYSRQGRNMEQARKEGEVFGFIFQQRTFPVYKKIRELVQSARWGKILRVKWVVTNWYRPDVYYASGSWRATWRGDGGGTLLNQCPHNLDLLQWICGMPARVQGFCHEGKYHHIEVEDDVTAYMEWENGATGVFMASTGEAAGVNRLEITMEDGRLVLDMGKLSVYELDKPEKEYRRDTENLYGRVHGTMREIPFEEAEDGYIALLENFAEAVEKGAHLIAPGEEGRKSLLLSNAIYLSSWEKRMVEIPAVDSREEREFEQRFEEWLQKKCNGEK